MVTDRPFSRSQHNDLANFYSLFTLVGDLWAPDFEYGPFFSFPMMGIPHDTGEGYLFEYHFNLQHMHFLRETNALIASQERDMLEYLNTGECPKRYTNFRRA